MSIFRILVAPLAALASLALSPLAQAQQHLPTPQPIEEVTQPREAWPALWKVSDEDTTIYLFGTAHLLPDGIEWYAGALPEALAGSDELVTELPDVSPDEIGRAALKYGTLPAGQSLRATMSAKERTRYEAALANLGLPPAVFDRYQPWFAAMAIGTLALQREGFGVENGVEQLIDARNKALGHPRNGLETIDFQLSLFAGLPAPEQKRFLFDVVDELPSIREDMAKLIGAWRVGDLDTLAELTIEQQDDPTLNKVLLTDRNVTWSKWLKARLDRPGAVFVAVGAGHLGGKDGVIALLGQAGIKAERVQ